MLQVVMLVRHSQSESHKNRLPFAAQWNRGDEDDKIEFLAYDLQKRYMCM